MSSKENDINKALLMVLDTGKDALKQSLVEAVRTKQINIDEQTLTRVLALCVASIDAGYHKSATTFTKQINAILVK